MVYETNPLSSSNLSLEKNQKTNYSNKRAPSKKRKFMRFLSTLITLCILGYGIWWINDTRPELKQKALEMINTGTFLTLEARYTSKQIMEKERSTLLKDPQHRYTDPSQKFHPYLLMEVKYTNPDMTTGEGIILWDLIDGEMVVDVKNWEKTHGFADCINSNADRYEFRILNIISKNGGSADRQTLMNGLNIENSLLDSWIDRCQKKKLIVRNGNRYRIHLSNPKINVTPATRIDVPLVTKNCKHTERITRRFTTSQIQKAAEFAFGTDFAVRNIIDVFLPIYSITVQNPDGSIHTTHWNALNGQKISHSSLIE